MDSKVKLILIGVTLGLLVSACTPKTEAELLDEAGIALAKNDVNAAIVVLKNAAQDYPQDAKVRTELGKALLLSGNVNGAVKEFNRAAEIEPSLTATLMPLYFEAFTLGKLTEDASLFIQNNDIEGCSSCQLSYAWTLLTQGKPINSIELPNNASDTERALLKLLKTASDRNTTIDKQLIEQIIADDSSSVSDKLIASEVALNFGFTKIATNGLKDVLSQRPENIWLKLPIAQSLVSDEAFQEANEYIDPILEINPNNALANFLKSLVFLSELDYQNAALYGARAQDYGYDTPQSKVSLGISQYRIKQFERALGNLESAASKLPPKHFVHQMVLATKSQLDGDVNITQELAKKEQTNIADLLLMGQSIAKSGNKAEELKSLLSKSIDSSTNSGPIIEQELFMLNLMEGKSDNQEKLNEATSAATSDKPLTMALVLYYLKNQDYAGAEKQLNDYLAENNDELELTNLLGSILTGQGKYEEAGKVYAKASELSKNNAPSLYFEVYKAIAQGDTNLAIQNAKTLLDSHPLNLDGLRVLSILSSNLRLPVDEPIIYTKRAIEKDGDNATYRLMLANLYVQAGSETLANKTLDAIKDPAIKSNNQYWEVKHYLASSLGSERDVDSNYNEWRKAIPLSINSVFSYSNYLIRKNDYLKASEVLGSVPDSHPEAYGVRATEFYSLIQGKQLREARLLLGRIERAYVAAPIAMFKGILFRAEGKQQESLASFTDFYTKNQTENSLILLVETMQSLGKPSRTILEEHIRKYPTDYKAINLLAESLIGSDNSLAAKYYARYFDNNDSNAIAMNNYAWLLQQLGELELAETYANKALALLPQNLNLVDTLAGILVAKQEYGKVIDLLSSVAADSVDLSITLSEAYSFSGKNTEAKNTLEKLSKMKMSAQQQSKYDAIKKTL